MNIYYTLLRRKGTKNNLNVQIIVHEFIKLN